MSENKYKSSIVSIEIREDKREEEPGPHDLIIDTPEERAEKDKSDGPPEFTYKLDTLTPIDSTVAKQPPPSIDDLPDARYHGIFFVDDVQSEYTRRGR